MAIIPLPKPEGPDENLIQDKLEQLIANEEAKRRFRDLKYPPLPMPQSRSGTQILEEPSIATEQRVDRLWPMGDKVLVAAEAKAGKTVLTHNLVKSLLTGEYLFDQFKVKPVEGNIVIVDSEMNVAMLDSWLRKQGTEFLRTYGDRLHFFPLRGNARSFNILDEETLIQWSETLRLLQAEVFIVDPIGPFISALGLNENTEARDLLYAIDELMLRAEVSDYLVTHHMGHGDDRARGDSAMLGWPAVLWNYKLPKTKANNRYVSDHKGMRTMSVMGRVDEIDDFQLVFDKETNHLAFSDVLQAPIFQDTQKLSENEEKILKAVGKFGEPISQNLVITSAGLMKATGIKVIEKLASEGRLVITEGPKQGQYPTKLISKSVTETL